jgi:hypothetical protein
MQISFTQNPTPSISFGTNGRARFTAVVSLNWDSIVGAPEVIDNLDDLTTTGLLVHTDASGTFATRTLTAGTGITITNGDGVSDNPTIALTTPQIIRVYPIIGDSNVSGFMGTGGPDVPSDVLRYNVGTDALVDPSGNTNLLPALGLELNRLSGDAILLINLGSPGSTIVAANDVGPGNWSTTGTLLPAAITSITAAMAKATAAGYTPVLKGIISEGGVVDGAPGYVPILTSYQDMIAEFRAEFGETLPVYIIRPGRAGSGGVSFDSTELAQIRTDIATICAADPYTQCVYFDVFNFAERGWLHDAVHWTQTGADDVGTVSAGNIHRAERAATGGDVDIAGDKALKFGGFTALSVNGAGTLMTVALATTFSGNATFLNTGLRVLDTDASNALIIAPGSNLTSNRTLTITTGDANRTFTIGADSSISGTAAVLAGAQTLTGGFSGTSFSAGTKSSGTYTPAASDSNLQHATNGGAHTLAPPSADCTIIVQYTNNGSAGAIATAGFTRVTGDAFTTTNGDDFLCYIARVNSFSHLHITALQ